MQLSIHFADLDTKYMISLQELFLKSRGAPLLRDGKTIIQMDRVPIRSAVVIVRLLNGWENQGVALKAHSGSILLSDGSNSGLVHIWADNGLSQTVSHSVDCPTGELRVWNIYRTTHPDGSTTEDAWTGNAGMIVDILSDRSRRYRCSDGKGLFDPSFIFELDWVDIKK